MAKAIEDFSSLLEEELAGWADNIIPASEVDKANNSKTFGSTVI